jgi:hypothetical protein
MEILVAVPLLVLLVFAMMDSNFHYQMSKIDRDAYWKLFHLNEKQREENFDRNMAVLDHADLINIQNYTLRNKVAVLEYELSLVKTKKKVK